MTIIDNQQHHSCSGCMKYINDLYCLNVGNKFYWHLQCLKCDLCMMSLQTQTKCFLTNTGKIYCADDYFKLKYSSSTKTIELNINSTQQNNKENIERKTECKKCKQLINSSDYVISLSNSINYHLNCFVCYDCHKLIMPGNQYAILNESILCCSDYFKRLESSTSNKAVTSSTIVPFSASLSTNLQQTFNDQLNNNSFHTSKDLINHQQSNITINQLPIILNNNQKELDHNNNIDQLNTKKDSNSNDDLPKSTSPLSIFNNNNNHHRVPSKSSISSNRKQSKSNKTSTARLISTNMNSAISNSKKKRIRTSFKHQQLRIMKAHFQINQNPDSKDLKELSERTGLQKRVLQVWFQNSRAKQRKHSSSSSSSINMSTNIINNHVLSGNSIGSFHHQQQQQQNGSLNEDDNLSENNDTNLTDDLDDQYTDEDDLDQEEEEEDMDETEEGENPNIIEQSNQHLIDFYF